MGLYSNRSTRQKRIVRKVVREGLTFNREGRVMRRGMIVVATVCPTMLTGATAAWAASPHIVGNPPATVSGNSLTLSASVAGLGSVETVTLSLEGTANVSSRCYTRSGNKPQAARKQETIDVNTSDTFHVRNGRTNATFTSHRCRRLSAHRASAS